MCGELGELHLSVGHLEGCLQPGAKCTGQVIGEKIWVSLRDSEISGIYVDMSLEMQFGVMGKEIGKKLEYTLDPVI